MHSCPQHNHYSHENKIILAVENKCKNVKFTSIYHFVCTVYAEVLTLARDSVACPRHTPSSFVPYETVRGNCSVFSFPVSQHEFPTKCMSLLEIKETQTLICNKNRKLDLFTLETTSK